MNWTWKWWIFALGSNDGTIKIVEAEGEWVRVAGRFWVRVSR